MNRHILGLTVFLVIVKTSFLLYWGFFAPQPFVHFTESEVYTETAANHQTNCFPKLDQPLSAPVDIATLDLENRLVNINLDLNHQFNFEPDKGFAVTLHFFTKDTQPREIGVETLWIQPEMVDDATNIANVRLTGSYSWLSQLKSNKSLYVIPRVARTNREARNLAVNYSDFEAIPVLLIAGKN
ncbi:MAG: hypothetical protein ABI954_14715 [Pyrinomonadaceae bacterium]